MSSTAHLTLDPYRVWLGINDSKRPLSPYELLRLPPLEENESRIAAARDRQRSALRKVEAAADPDMWQEINDELEAAIATLEDPDRKAILDADIRRRQKPAPAAKANGSAAAAHGPTVRCTKCGGENPAARRFCTGCGESLWKKCLQCNAELSIAERFCGECGCDVQGVETGKREKLEALLTEADSLLAEYQYDAAFFRLKEVATVTDTCFADVVERAVQTLNGFEARKAEALAAARKAYEEAQQVLLSTNFELSMTLLLDVHPNLRTPDIQDLLASATSMRDECLSLAGEIREAVANKQFGGLLPKLDRLLQLKPNHASARKLAEQMRDQILARAKRQLAERQYESALASIDSFPEFLRTEDCNTLADKVREVTCLLTAVRTAAVADETALAIGQRLSKIAVGDEAAAELVTKLEARGKQRPTDRRIPAADWIPQARATTGTAPVDWLGYFPSLPSEDPQVNELLAKHPGRFAVALGLALHGVGAANVSINYLPSREKSGLLGALPLSFGSKRATEVAWGLDLSPSALKAVKMERDSRTGAVKLLAADFIPHAKTLTNPEAEYEKREIAANTLKTFLERHKLEKETLVTGIAGHQTLGRFFELPPMPAKKLASAIEYEARRQFPIDLEELGWGHAILETTSPKEADSQPRRIVLSAARQFHIQERAALFESCGVKLDAIHSDCLALHAAAAHEFFAGPTNPAGAICLFDVGTDGTNIVIASRQTTWFRSVRQGTHELVSGMVRQFQLPYAQAEVLQREPHRARRLYQVMEAWEPWLVQLKTEVSKSVEVYRKLYPEQNVTHAYGLGGGFRTLGLLGQMRGSQ